MPGFFGANHCCSCRVWQDYAQACSEDGTMTGPENEFVCPVGMDFLKLVAEQEDQCEKETREGLPQVGKRVPAMMHNLGTVLSFVDRISGCFWGCKGGDHVVEYAAGRVGSTARAALRLILFGFYDEALSLTRSIGEIANLFLLCSQDTAAYAEWLASTKQERIRNFRPVRVRERLEGKDLRAFIDEARYRQMCEVGTHVTPQTKPQAHNILGMPCAGAMFQTAGVIVALNELGLATACATVTIPKLLGYDDARRREIRDACLSLIDSLGGLHILNVDEMFAELAAKAKQSINGESEVT
jgi:hypothetical protein